MRRHRVALLLGVAAMLLVIAVEAQGADDVAKVDKVGWWSKRPAAQPTTGPTSFEVANGVDGAESIAAVRVLIFGSVTKGTLIISEAANQTTSISVPKLQVCQTDTPWILTKNPGAYADAPKPECDKGAIALVRDDKGNWSADITNWLTGARSEVSVMVVPAADTTLPVPPTFFVQFATSRLEASGTPDVTTTTGAPKSPAVVAPSGGGTVTPVPSHSTPAPVTTPAAPTTAPTPTTVAASQTPKRLGGVPVASTTKRKQWGKLVWVVPLSALIAFGWVLGRKSLTERGALAPT
ncbi:MAG TPA: hypothetical protein VGZ52_12650 [Acidimicrobiales bacterium]|jgi:hypothetical protein|nr:hypothetical protein [Acidimicrobiales bacterium]